MAVGRSFRLYQKYVQGAPFSVILENSRNTEEFLLFESGVVASLYSRECEEFKKQYTKVLDAYGCLGVLQLYGSERSINLICMVTACISVGKIEDCDVYRITAVQFLPMWAPLPPGSQGFGDERVNEIQKLIGSGTFYFAMSTKEDSNFDLSLCAQKRHKGFSGDHRFFWNRRLHLHLQRYGINTDRWLLRCMCGGVEIKTVYVGHLQAKACLISRLSCERMGTRFNVRGVNDSGHVANFVETEQIIFFDDHVVSFIQTRGSVPLFWEQPGVQVGSHKVKTCRGFEATAPAYDRHFKLLKRYYGDCVIVNLLGNKEGERMLSQAFKTLHENSSHCDDVPYIYFDYHSMVRQNNRPQNLSILWDKVKTNLASFNFFHSKGEEILKLQTGEIRTNCLDCLDRTNCTQTFFALALLTNQLQALSLFDKANIRSRFEETFRQLWITNGDQCSRIYAGTGALEGKSKIKDASRSVTRTIQNNLMDGSKQEAMDLFLLGTGLNTELYDRASALLPVDLMQACPNVLASVVTRVDDFTVRQTIRVFCGTWNVNGGQRLNSVVFRRDSSLADWLLDLAQKPNSQLINVMNDYSAPIDIFAIGLEEIVDLNASNIMKASSTNHVMWTEEFKRMLSRDHKYILLNSIQLVGVSLFLFVRPHLAPYIKEVATDSVKTGLGGATGNKGGVAIRFVLHSTSFCFLCSHFAAGQSQVQERNNDFNEICKKVQFPMGRNIYSHDFVFWVGDFNYRIDLRGDDVKELVRENNLSPLIGADQLTIQRNAGNVFNEFREGPLTFAPTYKYDTFSDDYDTSEKCRAPAWTDRILWWQRPQMNKKNDDDEANQFCRLVLYTRAELKTSDHRPVGALFDVDMREVDETRRDEVYHSVVGSMGPADATVLVSVSGGQDGNGFPMDYVDGVLQKVAALGIHVLLVKFVVDDMWLIFNDGEMALAALSMDGTQVGSETLTVRLKSPKWEEECEKDLKQSLWPEGNVTYTLLSEDAAPGSDLLSRLDLEAEESEIALNASLTPLGGVSPAGSGRSTPVFQQNVNELMTEKSLVPPPRPSAPPKRPPPPKLLNGDQTLNQQQPLVDFIPEPIIVRGTESQINQQQPLANIVQEPVILRGTDREMSSGRQSSIPGTISYPTNVTHVGAKTPDEAKVLIESLRIARADSKNMLRKPSEPALISSPGDDDWADFVQTRKTGGSTFYRSSVVDGFDDSFAPRTSPPAEPLANHSSKPTPAPRRQGSKSKDNSPEDPFALTTTTTTECIQGFDPWTQPVPTLPIVDERFQRSEPNSQTFQTPIIPPRPAHYDPDAPAPPIPVRRAPPPLPR